MAKVSDSLTSPTDPSVVECLQKIFVLLDQSTQASENIDLAIDSFPTLGPLHPNSPGDDMKGEACGCGTLAFLPSFLTESFCRCSGMYDNGLALLCEIVMAHLDKLARKEDDDNDGLPPR